MPQKIGRNDNPIDRAYGQECSTRCKIQGQAVKEVALIPSEIFTSNGYSDSGRVGA
jgi:hypothetical protein